MCFSKNNTLTKYIFVKLFCAHNSQTSSKTDDFDICIASKTQPSDNNLLNSVEILGRFEQIWAALSNFLGS